MTNDIQLAPTSELIEELMGRCHDGCMIVCCYRDEMIPFKREGKEVVMTSSAGFANDDEIMNIMLKVINSMIINYKKNRKNRKNEGK